MQQAYKTMGDVIHSGEELLHKYHRDLYDFRVSQINFATLLMKEVEAVELLDQTIDFLANGTYSS